jgi:hypothetical protein
MPSAVKNAIAARRSSTTTLTWSNLLIVMRPSIPNCFYTLRRWHKGDVEMLGLRERASALLRRRRRHVRRAALRLKSSCADGELMTTPV